MADGIPQGRAADFRMVFDSLPGIFCVLEPREFRIVAASDAFVRAAGAERDHLIDRPLTDVFPVMHDENATARRCLRESLERVRDSGEQDRLPALSYLSPRDGKGQELETHHVAVTSAPVPAGGGEPQFIAQHIEDHAVFMGSDRNGNNRNPKGQEFTPAELQIVRHARELRRRNEHLRFAQRVACIGSMEYDIRNQSRTWSDEVCRILGLEPGTRPSPDLIAALVHPEDRKLLDEARREALRGKRTEFQHRIVRPDGSVRHVRERVELVSDENGEPLRLFGTLQDITEQVHNQERLERSEQLLRIAGQMAKLGAWQYNPATRMITWSEEAALIHDVPAGKPAPLANAIHRVAPAWRDRVRDALDACVHDGLPMDIEFPLVSASGRRSWLRATAQAVRDEGGNVKCIQGALQDITQIKTSEGRIEKLAEQLASTLENISDGFMTLDDNWCVTYLNRSAEKILQRSRNELLGHDIETIANESLGPGVLDGYRRAKRENRTLTFEERLPRIGNWLDITVYPSPEGLAVYLRDITDRKRMETANGKIETRTRSIIENALDAAITIDSDSVITAWNSQAEETFGWSRDQALGRRLDQLVIPARFRKAHREGIRRFIATGEGPFINRHTEVRALHRDGHEFPAELSIVALENDEVFTFTAFVRDITERKKTEQMLRENEERFRTVARVTADAVWDWDIANNVIWWSAGLRETFGYESGELNDSIDAWKNRIHPEDRARVSASLDAAIAGKDDEWREEYRFLRKDGSVAHVVDKGSLIRDDTGKVTRIVGGLNDVTRQKQHDSQLRQQAALLDKARDAIIVRDMDDRIIYWNKGAERLYGWTREEATGRLMEELLQPPAEVFRDANRRVLKQGEWTGEITKRRRNGEPIDIKGGWTLVRDKEGRPESVLTIDTDISERTALKEQLRQSQRLESVGKLTGGVAHDFNNLLTVILGNAELMLDQLPAGDRMHKLAEMTRTAARRGAELTHRLLAFARRQALEPQVVDINDLVLGMEDLLRRTLLENIDIEVIPNDSAWQVFVDPGQLEAVLLNLAINAKDAMRDGGLLTLEMENVELGERYAADNADVGPGRYVMVAVSDTGVGIPPEDLDRVFDPFFTTKEKGKGTGLGLSMAYGFAKQSEGHIKIYSEPGQGTTVRLYLPEARQPADSAAENARNAVSREPGPSGSEKVLVVEDDELVRVHAANQLQALGYNVLVAEDGPRAVEILQRENDIDLLFTDVIMSGGMSGRELAEMARRLRPKLKVLYTSGYTENAIVHQGRLDRGVHLLQKPYLRVELAKKLRQVLQEPTRNNAGGNRDDRSRSDSR